MVIKKEHLGTMVFSKNLKCLIELTDKSKNIFIRENRFDLFESNGENELKPVKKTRKKRTLKNDIPTETND